MERFCAQYEIHEIWGCLAKVCMPSSKRTTIGAMMFDVVFIGCVETSAAYRFLRLDDK